MATISRRGRLFITALVAVTCIGLTLSFLRTRRPQVVFHDARHGTETSISPELTSSSPDLASSSSDLTSSSSDLTSSSSELTSTSPELTSTSSGCRGARGGPINDPASEDLPHPVASLPNVTFKHPTLGSYDTLGLKQTWLTVDERYGPYGYGEDSDTYVLSRVNWSSVSWAGLQDRCLQSSEEIRGNQFLQVGTVPRFRFPSPETSQEDDAKKDPQRMKQARETSRPTIPKTGRQAIVLRTWSTYKYQPEDLWNIRSIISEASLAAGGEYTVFLLVDVKVEDGSAIHEDDALYRKTLEASVPEEFWDIAVLFHESLQESWYPKVGEYKTFWQVMQPFQLFAHVYPEFDHYWQLEMDARFTGDAGEMLRALHDFGKQQPYKQARERASWTYIPRVHGTYEEFAAHINQHMAGGAAWGPIKVEGISPVGSPLPVKDPHADNFAVGVGQDADLLLLTAMNDVGRIQPGDWMFKDWYSGDLADPRFMSVPAQARASWQLLEAIHIAQHEDGVWLPSEATLPTFALWHGMKVISAPMPRFQYPERSPKELNLVYNGGMPRDFKDGMANGAAPYNSMAVNFFVRPMSWCWWSPLPNLVFEAWMGEGNSGTKTVWEPYGENVQAPKEMPGFMAEVEGRVYAPNVMLHPRKTNRYRGPER